MASKTWIQTLSNRKLEPLALTPEMVGSVDEIAHALAHKYRFTCQTAVPYSVAEHCVRGAQLLPRALAGAFLLHELSEVYLPDIASPLKPALSVTLGVGKSVRWDELERQHTHVILEALGLSSIEPLIYSPEVKRMDLAMLAAEKRDLCGPEPEPWGLPVAPTAERIVPWTSVHAAESFAYWFAQYFSVPR